MDTDGNGSLTPEEFARGLEKLERDAEVHQSLLQGRAEVTHPHPHPNPHPNQVHQSPLQGRAEVTHPNPHPNPHPNQVHQSPLQGRAEEETAGAGAILRDILER